MLELEFVFARMTTLGKGTQCCEFILCLHTSEGVRSTVLFSKAIIGLMSYTLFWNDIISLYYR